MFFKSPAWIAMRIMSALLVLVIWLGTRKSAPTLGFLGFVPYVVGMIAIAGIVANLNIYLRGSEGSEQGEETLPTILGWILAVAGGFSILASAVLPWETSVSSTRECPCVSIFNDGLRMNGWGGVFVYSVGFLWLLFFAIPEKTSAVWGLFWGGFAFLFSPLAFARIADDGAMSAGEAPGWQIIADSGVYVNLVGSAMLILGSALVLYVEVRKALISPAVESGEVLTTTEGR